MRFPWNLLEPLLVPLVQTGVTEGFAAIPEEAKPFFCVAFCAYQTEIIAWANKTSTGLDNAAIVKLAEEVTAYLIGKQCPNLPGELDKLFAA